MALPVQFAHYNLFGLGVAAELALPLPPSPDAVQVEVVLGQVAADGVLLFQADDPFPFACYQQGDAIIVAWPGIRFKIVPERVVVDTEDHALAAHFLVPAVWSVVLSAHQRESLHGSAVEHGGHAMTILGLSGSGKTTAALTLLDHGWRLVTDDLLTFDTELRVMPGPPWIRLLPDHGGDRIGDPDVGGKLRVYPPTSPHPTPLTAMVIMAPEHTRCVRLSGTSAVAALLQHVYNPVLTHPGQVQRRFDLVHNLANRVPVYGTPPRSLTAAQLLQIAEETRT